MNYRILSIDYGSKRTGLAVTDQFKMIAYGLTTIKTNNLMRFLSYYIYEKNIQKVVVGEPKNDKNQPSVIEKEIQYFISKFCLYFPDIHIDRVEERFTSKLAKKTLFGLKKKYRSNKLILDNISATLILQTYLEKKLMYDV